MKKILGWTLIIGLFLIVGFVVLEPRSAVPAQAATSDAVDVTITVTSDITIDAPGDVGLSGTIQGIAGGGASGSATWTVRTSDNDGFQMTLKESNAAEALTSATDDFDDYEPSTAGTPDFNWTVGDSESFFGFTVEPATDADTVQLFLDDGSGDCDTGSTQTSNRCWFGFNGTSEITIINRSSDTAFGGEAEVVKFWAQLYNADGVPNNAEGFLVAELYTATITATVTVN